MTSAVSPRFGRRALKTISVSGSRGVPFVFSQLRYFLCVVLAILLREVSEWWIIECRYV